MPRRENGYANPAKVAMASSNNAATIAVVTMVRSSASMIRSVPYWLPVSGLANTICQMDASGGRNASRTCAASVMKPPATIARTVVFMSLRRANSAVNAIKARMGSYGKTSTTTHAATNVARG